MGKSRITKNARHYTGKTMKKTIPGKESDQKKVLITGGVRRMGLHIAYAFSERGAILGLNYHHASKKEAEAAQSECLKRGAKQVFLIEGDITREAREIAERFIKLAKGIDILVNNAGVLPPITP